jgi:hypothetical protein
MMINYKSVSKYLFFDFFINFDHSDLLKIKFIIIIYFNYNIIYYII